jgi:carotenoid cleavage dioxygenase-like enzyme
MQQCRYVFHPMNAYDDGDNVVIDVVRHARMFDAHRLGPDEGPPTLERWNVDLAAGKVVEERLDDRGQEFPASTSGSSGAGTATAMRARSSRARARW